MQKVQVVHWDLFAKIQVGWGWGTHIIGSLSRRWCVICWRCEQIKTRWTNVVLLPSIWLPWVAIWRWCSCWLSLGLTKISQIGMEQEGPLRMFPKNWPWSLGHKDPSNWTSCISNSHFFRHFSLGERKGEDINQNPLLSGGVHSFPTSISEPTHFPSNGGTRTFASFLWARPVAGGELPYRGYGQSTESRSQRHQAFALSCLTWTAWSGTCLGSGRGTERYCRSTWGAASTYGCFEWWNGTLTLIQIYAQDLGGGYGQYFWKGLFTRKTWGCVARAVFFSSTTSFCPRFRAHTSCLLHHRGGGTFSSGGTRWTGCHGWLRCNSSAYRCRAWTRVTGPLFVGGESQCPKSQSTREDGTSYGSFEWSCGNTSVVSLWRRWDGVGWDWKVGFLKGKTDYCRTFFKEYC